VKQLDPDKLEPGNISGSTKTSDDITKERQQNTNGQKRTKAKADGVAHS
jgi:hypothetical protein